MKALTFFATLLFCSAALSAETKIIVEAGEFDREDAVVEFKVPQGVKLPQVISCEGKEASVQTNPDGRAWFIEPSLKRGAQKTYVFTESVARIPVRATTEKGMVNLRAFGREVLTYRTEKTEFPPDRSDLKPIFHRGGYIHPVLSPTGKQITDDYPVNHKHHHGICFAWTHTEFEGRTPDFWNMGDGKGTVEFVSLDKTWSGPVHAGFGSKHRQIDLTSGEPKTALNETWNLTLYAVGNEPLHPYFLFDLEITDTCAGAPLKLPEYRYGGIGIRGNWAWNGKDKINFLNSDGITDRSKGEKNETKGHWAYMGGMLEGGSTGIAILDHPMNVRSPQPQRIHPSEPFLNLAPQQAGDVEITPGKPLTLRYRFYVADGAPNKSELDRLWNDYAHPPKVKVISE
jgi:hypothetical protein